MLSCHFNSISGFVMDVFYAFMFFIKVFTFYPNFLIIVYSRNNFLMFIQVNHMALGYVFLADLY